MKQYVIIILILSTFTIFSQNESVKNIIESNISTTRIPIDFTELSYSKDNYYGNMYAGTVGEGYPEPIIAFGPDGTAYLGFFSSDFTTYIFKLTKDMELEGQPIITIRDRRLEDMEINSEGIGLLLADYIIDPEYIETYLYWNYLYLEHYSFNGKKVFNKQVIGTGLWEKVGDQSYGGRGEISWSGSEYGVYFETFRKWGDGVVHQGDYLLFYDIKGNILTQKYKEYTVTIGWAWGTSHSFRTHLVYNDRTQAYYMATVGDANPMGLHYRVWEKGDYLRLIGANKLSSYMIYPVNIKRGDNDTGVSLGDIITSSNEIILVTDIKDKRESFDIAMFFADSSGKSTEPFWITSDPTTNDRLPKIANYGNNYFVAWGRDIGDPNKSRNGLILKTANTEYYAAIVSSDGKVIGNEEKISAKFRGNAQFFNYPNGDVGWIDVVSEPDVISIVRVVNPNNATTVDFTLPHDNFELIYDSALYKTASFTFGEDYYIEDEIVTYELIPTSVMSSKYIKIQFDINELNGVSVLDLNNDFSGLSVVFTIDKIEKKSFNSSVGSHDSYIVYANNLQK